MASKKDPSVIRKAYCFVDFHHLCSFILPCIISLFDFVKRKYWTNAAVAYTLAHNQGCVAVQADVQRQPLRPLLHSAPYIQSFSFVDECDVDDDDDTHAICPVNFAITGKREWLGNIHNTNTHSTVCVKSTNCCCCCRYCRSCFCYYLFVLFLMCLRLHNNVMYVLMFHYVNEKRTTTNAPF